MELTAIEKNKIAKFDAMTAAHKDGHSEVTLMILSDQIVVRSRRSGDWSVKDYQREVPAGAVALIYVDYTARKPEYYIVPAEGGAGDLQEALRRPPRRARRAAPADS